MEGASVVVPVVLHQNVPDVIGMKQGVHLLRAGDLNFDHVPLLLGHPGDEAESIAGELPSLANERQSVWAWRLLVRGGVGRAHGYPSAGASLDFRTNRGIDDFEAGTSQAR